MKALLTRELWPAVRSILAGGAPYAMVFDDMGDPIIDFGCGDCYELTPEIFAWIIEDAAKRNERPFPPRMGVFLKQLGWHDSWSTRYPGD